jgi:hypothetical protein
MLWKRKEGSKIVASPALMPILMNKNLDLLYGAN